MKINNENDSLVPPQVCIMPPIKKSTSKKKPKIKIEQDTLGDFFTIKEFDSNKSTKVEEEQEEVKITLYDCLSCTGCITSQESILIESQSLSNLPKILENSENVVISLSHQSRVSIAAYFGLSVVQAHSLIYSFFKYKKNLKIPIFDLSIAEDVYNMELFEEFQKSKKRPIIVSNCPGWVTNAEKKHAPYVLKNMSRVKSPTAIMGLILKDVLYKGAPVFHITIASCYDKKLEAADSAVDMVLGTKELYTLITGECTEDEITQYSQNMSWVDDPNGISGFYDREREKFIRWNGNSKNGTSGGMMAYFRQKLAGNQPVETFRKGKDWIAVHGTANGDGRRFGLGLVYGLRNMETFVSYLKNPRKVTRQNLKFYKLDFVELEACPSGCINGGAQIEPKLLLSSTRNRITALGQILKVMTSTFEDVIERFPDDNEEAVEIHRRLNKKDMYRDFEDKRDEINQLTNPLSFNW